MRQLQRQLGQTRSELKLMQDEFFKKDRNHQEAMDKKREERNEAIRELGERVAHLPLLVLFWLTASCPRAGSAQGAGAHFIAV